MHMCIFPGAGRTVEGSKETPVSVEWLHIHWLIRHWMTPLVDCRLWGCWAWLELRSFCVVWDRSMVVTVGQMNGVLGFFTHKSLHKRSQAVNMEGKKAHFGGLDCHFFSVCHKCGQDCSRCSPWERTLFVPLERGWDGSGLVPCLYLKWYLQRERKHESALG